MDRFFFSQVPTVWSANPNRRRIYLYGGFAAAHNKQMSGTTNQGQVRKAIGLRFQAIVTPSGVEFHGYRSGLRPAELSLLHAHLSPQSPDLMAAFERLYFTDLPRGRLGRAPFRLSGFSLYNDSRVGDWIEPAKPGMRANLIALPNRPLGNIDIRLAAGSPEVLLVDHANWSYGSGPYAGYQIDPPRISFGSDGATLAAAGSLLAARLEDPLVAAATLEGLAEIGRPLRQAVDDMAAALARMG